mgnify:CR=1 FL=1
MSLKQFLRKRLTDPNQLSLLLDLFTTAKYRGWAAVIVSMRVLHVVVAAVILATIYGPRGVRSCTRYSQLLDMPHMTSNPKMYSLASFLTLFDMNAFVLLPWRDSEFAARSFGLPSMSLFRLVQGTVAFTGVVSIASQVPYLANTPLSPVSAARSRRHRRRRHRW